LQAGHASLRAEAGRFGKITVQKESRRSAEAG
jgi:hypothetical protein